MSVRVFLFIQWASREPSWAVLRAGVAPALSWFLDMNPTPKSWCILMRASLFFWCHESPLSLYHHQHTQKPHVAFSSQCKQRWFWLVKCRSVVPGQQGAPYAGPGLLFSTVASCWIALAKKTNCCFNWALVTRPSTPASLRSAPYTWSPWWRWRALAAWPGSCILCR